MKRLVFILGLVVLGFTASAKIELGAPFSDGVVLQRGMKVPVWGCAEAGETVTVEFAGQKKEAKASDQGSWRVDLDPMEACAEGRELKVNDRIVKDVLVGEVWFASGQSNMECPIWGSGARYRDMKGGFMTTMTRLPLVRYIHVYHSWSVDPIACKSTKWCKFTPEDLQMTYRVESGLVGKNDGKQLSAVAFYYARELYIALGIPIGIVEASWGGTNIDAWTPRCGYENCDPSIQATADYQVKDMQNWKMATDRMGAISGQNQQPTVLWNGMVDSFTPMAMRGFIWYQGCHNSGESQLYCAKMHALYNGWSKAFENPNLKLYFVELAPYNSNWTGICAAQNKFVSEEKNAALAVTADVGNFYDIHPNDKEIVAKRLVLHALKRDYGFNIPQDNSPVFKSVEFKDCKAVMQFDNVKDWYVYAPDYSKTPAFEVAGKDGAWEAAKIVNWNKVKDRQGKDQDTEFITGSEIAVASEKVPEPVNVRYMVKDRTAGTMYNEASLPLGVFQAK